MPSDASVKHEGREGAQRHECTHEKTQGCGKTIYPVALLPSYKGNLKDRHDPYCNRREQEEYVIVSVAWVRQNALEIPNNT